jgi:hypothetical protein
MPLPEPTGVDVEALRRLLEKATARPWELQDGCSWRRIGTRGHDGNVLCPSVYSNRDNHPDLVAGRGEDVYDNLRLIVALVNAAPALIASAERASRLEAAFQYIDAMDWKRLDDILSAAVRHKDDHETRIWLRVARLVREALLTIPETPK